LNLGSIVSHAGVHLAAYRIPETWFFGVAPDAIAGNNMKKGRFFISPLTVISIETLEDL
jgi:hypothetical protein